MSFSSRVIDTSKYNKIEMIGRGGFGSAFLCQDPVTNQYVVVKNISIDPRNPRQFQDIVREIETMDSIRHPTIHRILGYSPADPSRFKDPEIITEYKPMRSLDQLISKYATPEILPPDFKTKQNKIIYGIAYGMNLLHQHEPPIIHRDLKPGNVLLDSNYEPCISDFGLSKFVVTDTQTNFTGTLRFMAPEMMHYDIHYTTAIDVYAYGLILYQFFVGSLPHPEIQNDIDYAAQVRDGLTIEVPPEYYDYVPLPFRNLIKECCARDPKNRPKFCDILTKLEEPEYLLEGTDRAKYEEYRNRMLQIYPSEGTLGSSEAVNIIANTQQQYMQYYNPYVYAYYPRYPQYYQPQMPPPPPPMPMQMPYYPNYY
ncbi:TKL family protein kinase [Histomonas meleagridis]|uniref:TKL family protein kinase n=1 Tax=Histomonas meleagridis TaxID=135588 RepID=UPI0035596019|nr:TKL family protein kinase [Histomonas meleagridis]KAH0799666.1 TKL family protein kinase [Histomonas meleagridis]